MRLIIEDDEGRKTVVHLQRDEITIGRQDGNTIRLTERNVSRKHARLVRQNGGFVLEDLGSYNGVRINGDRVQGSRALHPGDVVQIGDYDLALLAEGAPEDLPVPVTARMRAPEGPPPLPAPPKNLVREVKVLPAAEQPYLTSVEGPLGRASFAITRSVMSVGRLPGNDLLLEHVSVAGRHVQLVREGHGGWRVVDQGASPKPMLNGVEVTDAPISFGDRLTLGEVVLHFGPQPDAVTQPSERPAPKRPLGLFAVVGGLVIAGAAVLLGRDDPAPAPAPAPVAAPVLPQPVPANPAPTSPPVDLGADELARAREHLTKGELADAEADARSAQGLGSPGAPALLEAIMAEREHAAIVMDATERVSRDDLEGALKLLSKVPASSHAAAQAAEVRGKIAPTYAAIVAQKVAAIGGGKRWDEANEVLSLAEKLAPGDPALAKARQDLGPDPAEKAFREGVELKDRGQCKQAVVLLSRAVEYRPTYAAAHRELGTCYAALQDGPAAVRHHENFLRLAPDDPAAAQIRKSLEQYRRTSGAP